MKVKLNIAMTYPIKWGKYAIMRDYIQNFFDAVGPTRFQYEFRYKYENQVLVMWTEKGFDKEWLYYIGASSKRNSKEMYAGRFGEGFKVASLIAYRDYKLKITMESRDWKISVIEMEELLDGQKMQFLGYDVSKRIYEDNAVLTLEGVGEELYDAFTYSIEHFYYEGNPRFGRMISCGKDFAVYHVKEPQEGKHCRGYLYAAYQERKSFRLPIIICNHTYMPFSDDRDREDFSVRDTVYCMEGVLRKVQPAEAFEILQTLSMCWRGVRLKGVNFAPERIVLILIQRMCTDETIKKQFFEMYNETIVANFCSTISKNRKRIALAWYRASKYYGKRQVVIQEFTKLGITDLEKLCEQNNGFQIYAEPSQKEQLYINILEETVKENFNDIVSYEHLPECKIVLNREAPIDGYTLTVDVKRSDFNQFGLKVRSEISNVYLQRYLFDKDNFGEALSVYMHELLHQYGGDSSIQFHKALLLMNQRILEKNGNMERIERQWRAIV